VPYGWVLVHKVDSNGNDYWTLEPVVSAMGLSVPKTGGPPASLLDRLMPVGLSAAILGILIGILIRKRYRYRSDTIGDDL
jgi:hypothetical protein